MKLNRASLPETLRSSGDSRLGGQLVGQIWEGPDCWTDDAELLCSADDLGVTDLCLDAPPDGSA